MVRRKLATRLTVMLVLVCLVPLGALAAFLVRGYARAAEETVRTRLLFASDVSAAILQRHVAELEAPLITVAQLLAQTDADAKSVAAVVGASLSLGSVTVYDEQGALVDVFRKGADVSPSPALLDPAIRTTVDARGRYVGPVEKTDDGVPALPLVVAAKGPRLTWYVATRVPTRPLSEAIYAMAAGTFLDFEARPDLARSLFVVDTQNQTVAHSDPELVDDATNLAHEPILASLHLVAKDLDGFSASTEVLIDGAPWLGVTKVVRGLPFVIVAQTPRAYALRDFTKARRVAIAAVLVIAAAAIALAVRFARGIAASLARLADYARDLAARRFERRIQLGTGDELELVGDAMSGAAEDLQASEAEITKQVAIRTDLGRYLSSQLVDRVMKREQALTLGGERRTVTVMFADVAGFTSLVENHDAEKVVALLNQLFTVLTEIIFHHGGTIDKFIGDCVMAFWNAPDEQPDHARRALAAATDMRRWLDVGNEIWRKQYGINVQLAIGVHTGEVIVGNLGSEHRMEFTCIGDAVNLAARLESVARPLQILATRATVDAAGGAFEARDLGAQRFAGRMKPIDVCEIIV